MKRMEDMTRLGRIRRARKIIEMALKDYDIEVDKLTYLTEATNIFYKLVDRMGRRYAVKVYEELSSNEDDSHTEIFFLDQVKKGSDIQVPEVIENRQKGKLTLVDHPVDGRKRVAVYAWLDGKDLDGLESPEHFYQIGVMMAKLHNLSESMTVPKTIVSKKLDKVLYYAGDDYFYKKPEHKKFVSDEYVEIVDFIMPILDQSMEALYSHKKPMLIHGDFNPSNIRLHDDVVHLLDFEDTSIGYPIHDISILLYYYRFDEPYEAYKASFFEGYGSVRPLPDISDKTMDMLMVARDVNFLNYILEISDDPSKYIEKNLKRVKDYLNKYHPEFYKN